MKVYVINVYGTEFSVIPIPEVPRQPREFLLALGIKGYAVFVCPSDRCDLSLRGVYVMPYGVRDLPLTDTVLAFSAFWREIRGTPLDELELAVGDKDVELHIIDTPRGIVAHDLKKCKVLLSKEMKLADGVVLDVYDVYAGGLVRVVRCVEPERFQKDVLSSLSVASGRGCAVSSVAFSSKGGEVRFVSSLRLPFDTCGAAALTALFAQAFCGKAGDVYNFSSGNRRLQTEILSPDSVRLIADCSLIRVLEM